MSYDVDTLGDVQFFVDLTEQVVSWLAPTGTVPNVVHNVFAGDPGLVYDGPRPYLVWTPPRRSVAHGNSGQVATYKGEPNIFVGSYRDTPFVGEGQPSQTSAQRAWRTFDIIAHALVSEDGKDACPPKGVSILEVRMEHGIDTQYIDTGNGPELGILIIVRVTEEYNNG